MRTQHNLFVGKYSWKDKIQIGRQLKI
jgi:hypothetical protein